ncbi:tetratricopeptide repeat protein [Shivajiella indica]|uniref:Tetratricopeptide repeat protein n=1 Tax=Shivajiella indica TaxID=872115 RepID=A0ABW5B5Z0_9BACT
MKIHLKILFYFLLIFSLGIQAIAQEKLSKKERKKQMEEARASRLFIDGQRFLMLEDFDRSYFYFQKAREMSPNSAAINFKIAELLLRANRVDDAVEYGMRAVQEDPDNKYYNLVMAEVYSKQGQPQKAAEILENLMANSEENQNYILDLASLYLTAGDFDHALNALDRAEDYYGVAEQLTIQKQRIYLRKNDLPSAIKEGEKLIDAHPGNSQYVLNLVEILFNNGRTDQAIDLINKSLDSYPNQPELQLAAYALFKEKGEVDKSEELIQLAFSNPDLEGRVKAEAFSGILQEVKTVRRDALLDNLEKELLELHPNDPDVLTIVGDRFLFENNKTAALEQYKKALLISPSNEQVLQGVITLMFELGMDYAEIESYTNIAVDEFPVRADFWFFDGTSKLAQKKGEEAEVSFLTAMEVNEGKNKQLELLIKASLGDTYHLNGKSEEAFKAYQEVLSARPEDEHVLNNYAYYLSLKKQDLEKAKEMSGLLVKKFPKNATYLDTYAWVLFQLKDYENAKIYMERALENEEKPSGVMLEHYGDILYHLGKRSEAITYWKKAEGGEETSEFLYKKIKDQRYYD